MLDCGGGNNGMMVAFDKLIGKEIILFILFVSFYLKTKDKFVFLETYYKMYLLLIS